MAIIKKATNIRVYVKNEHTRVAAKIETVAEEVFVYAVKEDLSLNSNKKIIANGNK